MPRRARQLRNLLRATRGEQRRCARKPTATAHQTPPLMTGRATIKPSPRSVSRRSTRSIRRTRARLKVLCTYDTGQYTGFNSGLIEVDDALIFTTEFDIFSIDPATCRQNWRTHEDYTPATPQPVSRGAAYLDGLLFRGSGDGRVLAYDFKTGKRVWETSDCQSENWRDYPGCADRLGRPGVHR